MRRDNPAVYAKSGGHGLQGRFCRSPPKVKRPLAVALWGGSYGLKPIASSWHRARWMRCDLSAIDLRTSSYSRLPAEAELILQSPHSRNSA